MEVVKGLMLLTMKKVSWNADCVCDNELTDLKLQVIYAANVSDSDLATGNEMSKKVKEYSEKTNSKFVIVSAQVHLTTPPSSCFSSHPSL
jgi:ribosome-binding ATPase YchF (GTP1/OBG family)